MLQFCSDTGDIDDWIGGACTGRGITDQNGAINDTQITNFMLHQGYNFYSNRHMLTIKNLAPNTEYAVRVGTRKAGGYTDYKPWPPGSDTWDLSRTVLKDHTPNNFTELGQNQYKYFDLAWHEKTLIFKTPPEPEYPKPHVYFVSAATGDDFNHNGLSLQTPWKTINKATCDLVITGTPIDLRRVFQKEKIRINKRIVHVRYDSVLDEKKLMKMIRVIQGHAMINVIRSGIKMLKDANCRKCFVLVK